MARWLDGQMPATFPPCQSSLGHQRPKVSMRPLLALLLVSAPVAAQQVPETRLTKPDARYPRELSSVSGLFELPDGRVLVSDGIDETLLRIDLRTMKTDTIGRSGAGPGEYKGPDLLYGLPEGGVLLVDLGNGRLSFFDGALKYKESAPIMRGQPQTGMTSVMPDAVDAQGRIYFRSIMRRPGTTPADSGAVVRWDRAAAKFDTVARIKLGAVKVTTSGGENNRNVSMQGIPYSPEDAWSAAPDGRIAMVRAADYHLEWIPSGGTIVRGPANSVKSVPVRDAEKREYAADLRNGISMQVTMDNGKMSTRMGRGGPRDQGDQIPNLDWPASKPAFRAVRVAPNGDAWVERSVAAGAPREFDIFGADAKMKSRVVLPAGRRLVGFGKGVIYVREVTEDELSYLEQYKLP